jgi:hypothetical protein
MDVFLFIYYVLCTIYLFVSIISKFELIVMCLLNMFILKFPNYYSWTIHKCFLDNSFLNGKEIRNLHF